MTIRNLFLLLMSWILLLEDVHCSDNSLPLKLPLPSAVIHNDTHTNWKDMNDKNSRVFQSSFNLEKYQKKRLQSCKITVKASGRPDHMLKLEFQRNSVFHKCNFSRPLRWSYNGLDNLKSDDVFDKIRKFARLLLGREIFRDLENLKTITYNTNAFSAIPVDLFHSNKRLKIIELKQNKVNLTDLPSGLFSGLADLEVVLLHDIGLHQLTEDLFYGLHNLKEIDLSNNYLRVLPKNLLRDASELRIFNASSNYLTTLPSGMFITANRLNQLNLSYNYIRDLNSSDLFVGLHGLEILDMKNNNLTFTHANAFIALPNLKIANFSGNHLNLTTGLYDRFGHVSPFRHCHFIEELDLSGNMVSEIFRDWIWNHTKLRKLDLSGNKLRYIEADDLRFNSSNLYVDLSNNNIEIVNLTQLQHIPKKANSSRNVVIDLNWNPIYCNCDVYSLVLYSMNETSDLLKPEDLNYVKLKTDNLYCDSSYKWGQRINHLSIQVLTCGAYEVRENRLSSCPDGCFCQLIPKFSIFKIDCSNRSSTEAPNWINTWHINFAYVDFSYNALQRTPDMTIGGYESPRELYLDLSGNQIDRIGEYSVPGNLRALLLDDNKLTEADMEFVKLKAPKAITKGARERSWPCDGAISFYQQYAMDCFKLKKSIDWNMNQFMCSSRTIYFTQK